MGIGLRFWMAFNKRRLRVLEKYSPQCVNDFKGDFRPQKFLDKESIIFNKKVSKIALKIAKFSKSQIYFKL